MASHQSFKRAAGLMLVAVLASRLLGLVREMLIARQFGQSGAVSAYTAAFNLPDLLYFFLSSGALSSAFIPVFTERFRTGREKEAWQIFSIIACFMGLVLLGAVALFWIYAKPLSEIFAVPGFVERYPKLVPITILLTRIVLPCQLFFFLGGLMMGTLESRQKFSARAAGPVIYNIGIIFGAIVLSRWFNIAGLAWGALIGAFVGNVVYAYYCLRKEGYSFYPSLNIRHPGVVRVGQLALPVILGLSLPQIDVLINRWFASFVSASAPAAINYANRLMQVPLGIFAQAAGTAILPMLAAYAAKNAIDDMRSGIAYGMRAILVENIPATLFMMVMADPLVRMIYMSGEFRPSDVPVTSAILVFYSAGIFAWAGQAIVARGFFAMQDTITPVLVGTVSTVIFLPLNYFLMKSMGAGGIALSTTIAATLHFLGLTWFLRGRLHGIEGRKTLATAGKILLAATVMAGVCLGVRLGMAQIVGSWQFQDGDIRNPAQLAVKLQDRDTPLSTYLYSKLSSNTHQALRDTREVERLRAPLETAIVDEINREISRAGSDSAQIKKRRFLEKAYAADIMAYDQADPWIAKLLSLSQPRKALVREKAHPWMLDESEITDFPALVTDLVDDGNDASKRLVSGFSDPTKDLLNHYASALKSANGLPQSMMHDLNAAIRNDSIYSPERFEGIAIAPRLQALIDQEPSGKQLAHLNRRLLEAAYPADILKRPVDRVESRMGSALTVMVALLLAGAIYLGLLRLLKVDELDFIWNAIRRRIFKRGGNGAPPADADATALDMGIEPD